MKKIIKRLLDITKLEEQISELRLEVEQIKRVQEKSMYTIDQVLADVQSEKDQIASVGALVTGLRRQVTDLTAAAGIPADVQAKIDAVFTQAESNKADLAAAIATPGA